MPQSSETHRNDGSAPKRPAADAVHHRGQTRSSHLSHTRHFAQNPGSQTLHAYRVDAEAEPEVVPTTPQDAHAATLLPPELLQSGELIILLLKPSAWFILLGSLRFLATVGIVALGMLWLGGPQGWQFLDRSNIVLLGAIICGARVFWQFLVWLSHVYVLTDRRIIRVAGVLRVSVFETSLKKVQHTTAYFSIRERLFGLGSIGFATAGTAVIETWWLMVNNPLEVHRTIGQTLNRYR